MLFLLFNSYHIVFCSRIDLNIQSSILVCCIRCCIYFQNIIFQFNIFDLQPIIHIIKFTIFTTFDRTMITFVVLSLCKNKRFVTSYSFSPPLLVNVMLLGKPRSTSSNSQEAIMSIEVIITNHARILFIALLFLIKCC